jgi:transmembrane sensor
MNLNQERVRDLIAQEAAEWFVANRAALSVKDRQLFSAWLKASPVHVEEYLAISLVSRDLQAACQNPENSVESLLARAQAEEHITRESPWTRFVSALSDFRPPRWQTAAFTAAALVVVCFGVIGLRMHRTLVQPPAVDEVTILRFATGHGEQRTERLADNSVLHLNTDSAVVVRYSRRERAVTLETGEAEFEVVHLTERPFHVSAGAAEVVDVGTTFNVRLAGDATVVTVLEGLVAVAPLNESRNTKSLQLGANKQISVHPGEWPATIVPVDAQRSTAWLHRQITFEHEPLARVVSEFNRYSAKPIEITSPALRRLEISGVFSIDDPEAFIAFLRSLEGVHVEVSDKRIRVSQE